jgi:hypothetical protein
MTTPFWTNDPTILLNKDNITEVWPLTSMDYEQKLNAISRLVIVLTIRLAPFLLFGNNRLE